MFGALKSCCVASVLLSPIASSLPVAARFSLRRELRPVTIPEVSRNDVGKAAGADGKSLGMPRRQETGRPSGRPVAGAGAVVACQLDGPRMRRMKMLVSFGP